jgi:hypothetical protein
MWTVRARRSKAGGDSLSLFCAAIPIDNVWNHFPPESPHFSRLVPSSREKDDSWSVTYWFLELRPRPWGIPSFFELPFVNRIATRCICARSLHEGSGGSAKTTWGSDSLFQRIRLISDFHRHTGAQTSRRFRISKSYLDVYLGISSVETEFCGASTRPGGRRPGAP